MANLTDKLVIGGLIGLVGGATLGAYYSSNHNDGVSLQESMIYGGIGGVLAAIIKITRYHYLYRDDQSLNLREMNKK